MATSSAFWAYGSQLQMGDGATPEVFTKIAEVKDISAPSVTKDSIEVTSNDSSDGWREFIPGWKDGDTIDFDINWLPNNSTHDETTGLWAKFNTDTNHNWKIVLPSSIATIEFTGHIESFDGDLALEESGQASISIKVSGKITIS